MTLPAKLVAAVATASRGARPVVVIDGGAGSGKTTLAERLVADWPAAGAPQLVSLDDLYPGWHGLAAGSAAVPELIAGHGYRRWDWEHDRPGAWRELEPSAPLIVEGCGALSPASRALATLAVWVDLDSATRRERALARDGATFAEHWADWAAQEADHWAAHRPWELADLTVEA